MSESITYIKVLSGKTGCRRWRWKKIEDEGFFAAIKWCLPLINHEKSIEDIKKLLPEYEDRVEDVIAFIKEFFPTFRFPDFKSGKERVGYSFPKVKTMTFPDEYEE